MHLAFKSAKFKKSCEAFALASRAWGPQTAKQLVKRLEQLQAAENLELFGRISPGAVPHPLKGKRQGKFAIKLHGGLRLVFEPLDDPAEYLTPDGIDRQKITSIKILEVTDYHD